MYKRNGWITNSYSDVVLTSCFQTEKKKKQNCKITANLLYFTVSLLD